MAARGGCEYFEMPETLPSPNYLNCRNLVNAAVAGWMPGDR